MELLWAVLGVAVGAIGTLLLMRWTTSLKQADGPSPEDIPEALSAALELSREPHILAGDHDQVLSSSVQARTFGLVRGARIVRGEVLEAVRTARREESTLRLELERDLGVDSPRQLLEARVAPVTPLLTLVLIEDRTAARRVDDTRRDFVANISHELKTPIGAIQLLSEALADAADDEEAVHRFATRLSGEATRLSALVGQIIDLSRLQSDDPMMRASDVEIVDVLGAAAHRHRELADSRDVTISVASDPRARVLGDSALLTDAVSNLIQNALSYSDPGARVAVVSRVTREDGDEVVDISVSDNGIGISPKDMQRIFERFYRVDYARSRDSGGTGLGLSIVKHIAAVHGGSVSVWSQLGQGSTFTMRLPAGGPPDDSGRDAARQQEDQTL